MMNPTDGVRIPATPHYNQQNLQTPDNGLLYLVGNNTIFYLPAPDTPIELPHCQNIIIKTGIKSIDCPSVWPLTNQRNFAVLDKENMVGIWNVDTGEMVQGHKGHVPENSDCVSKSGALCYMKNGNEILSAAGGILVKYCILSNTIIVLHKAKFNIKKLPVTILRACPYDQDLFVAGIEKGLLCLVDYNTFERLYSFRGHDTEINSIEWLLLDSPDNILSKPKRELKPILDNSDVFDAYSFDRLDDEFGVMVDANSVVLSESETHDRKHSEINETHNFDFIEECRNLRDDILREISDTEEPERNIIKNKEIQKCTHHFERMPGSDTSDDGDNKADENLSDRASSIIEELHESLNKTLNETDMEKTVEPKLLLASIAQDNFIWIWDIKTGAGLKKIELSTTRHLANSKISICSLNKSTLIGHTTNGDLVLWKLALTQKNSLRVTKKNLNCLDNQKCSAVMMRRYLPTDSLSNEYIWIFTKTRKIMLYNVLIAKNDDVAKMVAQYSTIPVTIYEIRECPHDRNKIVVAGNGNRLTIFNITNPLSNRIFCNKIKSKILAVAWHPEDENKLAFSTEEGTIGIFNTSKETNMPDYLLPFSGKSIYQVSWAYIELDKKQECVLFACSNGKLVYYPIGKNHNLRILNSVHIPIDEQISSVSAGIKYVALGSNKGCLIILSLKLNTLYSTKIANKYITECAWSNVNAMKLSVSSMETDIYLYNCENVESDQMELLGILKGHKSSVTATKWSNQSEYRLISHSLDGMVCVWDTEHLTCIAQYNYKTKIFASNFLPTDENFILCSGQSETLHIFDVRKHSEHNGSEKELNSNSLTMQWATEINVDIKGLKEKELNKQRKLEKKTQQCDNANELCDSIQGMSINGGFGIQHSMQMKYTTIFHLSNKELNKYPLKCFRAMLQDNKKGSERNEKNDDILHTLLFSTRADVKKLLELELQNHIRSNTESIGRILIPMINSETEGEILNHIRKKTLTEQHVSISPMISYRFWKKCCKAFAFQSIERGCTLQAMPYLLACHKIDETIDELCQSNYYREAWIVARINNDANGVDGDKFDKDDLILMKIAEKWIKFHECKGDLDGAALIAASLKKYERSVDILMKRKNISEETLEIIKLLKAKLS